MTKHGHYGTSEDSNKNSVVLKVDGNLTIEQTYLLSTVGNGLLIYCTGTFTMDGAINMNGVVCSVPQKNLYLYKNKSGALVSLTGGSGTGGRGTGDSSSNAGSAGNVWRGGTGGTATALKATANGGNGGGLIIVKCKELARNRKL